MDNQSSKPLAGMQRPALSLILEFADAHGLDLDNETAERLVRLIHSCAIPLDGEQRGESSAGRPTASSPAPTSKTGIIAGSRETAACPTRDLSWCTCLIWTVTAAAGTLVLTLSGMAWGLQAVAYAPPLAVLTVVLMCVSARAKRRRTLQADRIRKRTAGPPVTGDHDRDEEEPPDDVTPELTGSARPVRLDRIYEEPVRVEVEGQGGGTVTHPQWDGRVRVAMQCARPRIMALDDLTPESRQSLKSAKVRQRVEVHVRCSIPTCHKALRAWLTPQGRVENTKGETMDAMEQLGLLFSATCEEHAGRGGGL